MVSQVWSSSDSTQHCSAVRQVELKDVVGVAEAVTKQRVVDAEAVIQLR